MLNSTDSPPSNSFLESSLKLLVAFGIICISITLLQSDNIASGARRGINNAITLAVFLVDDILTGIAKLSASPRTHEVLFEAQRLMLKLIASAHKNITVAVHSAFISRRVEKTLLILKNAVVRSAEIAGLVLGNVQAFLVSALMLAFIALHAAANCIRTFIATTNFTAIILNIGNFMLKNILKCYDHLYNISAILRMHATSAGEWCTTHIFTPDLFAGFGHLIWTPLNAANMWLWSSCETLGIFTPFRQMVQELEGVFEMVFGTGDVAGQTFGDLARPEAGPHRSHATLDAAKGEYQSPWKDRLRKRSNRTVRSRETDY